MSKTRVYIPQEPMRWDAELCVNKPTMDFTPALRYGELVVCLSHGISFHITKPVLTALREKMHSFTADDYLIAVGSPLMIALSSAVALERTGGKLQLLTWDRREAEYLVHRIEM